MVKKRKLAQHFGEASISLNYQESDWLTISLFAASLILSTLASESPFTLHSARLVVIWIPLIVQIPTDFSFLISATFCEKKFSSVSTRDSKQLEDKVNLWILLHFHMHVYFNQGRNRLRRSIFVMEFVTATTENF